MATSNLQTMDARIWAKTWAAVIARDPSIPQDEGTMVSWFANSIMAGYDEALRRSTRRADKLREALAALVGAKDRDTLIQMRSVILATGGDAAAAALGAVNVLIEDYHAQ